MGTRARAGAAAALAVGFMAAALVAAPGATAVPAADGPGLLPAQDYSWSWSDGSLKTRRTFAESRYTESTLPKVVVRVSPKNPRQLVKLIYKDKATGEWKTEDSGRTSASTGEVRLSLNPICKGNRWCNATYEYRVTASGVQPKELTIRFVND